MINASGRVQRRLAVMGAGVVMLCSAPVAAQASSAEGGDVFILHGLPGIIADVLIDGEVVEEAVEPQTIVGPLALAAGEHAVTLHPTSGLAADLSATVDVEPGASIDIVAHSSADPTAPPTVTVYPNDLSAVAPGKSRLAVAHTAAVPPADIRVNGEVLFNNVANGEVLTLVVPSGTYSVDIVPTGTSGPAVFGPVDLPVAEGQLTRVFAFGDPAQGTMDVAVQTLPVPVEGAAPPGTVDTGDGGQAADKARRGESRFAAAPTDPAPSPVAITISALGSLILARTALRVVARRRSHA